MKTKAGTGSAIGSRMHTHMPEKRIAYHMILEEFIMSISIS